MSIINNSELAKILTKMSSAQLTHLSEMCQKLAQDLKKKEPSYELALLNGIQDKTYNTVRNGIIPSYGGETIIKMNDGTKWKAIGHRSSGTAHYVSRVGWIEFVLLSSDSD